MRHLLGLYSPLRRCTPLAVQIRCYADKEVFKRDKPHCNVGTIGHVDHGKTSLTSAITKVLAEKNLAKLKRYEDIDSTKEEQQRGITMKFTIVGYATEARHYSHTDCPGHADYVKNMITGTSQMDGAILVVAGTDGVMPQTREHLILAKQIGIEHIVVYINKADAADSEMLELVEMEVRELLSEMGFDGNNAPVIHGSALSALQGKDEEIGTKSIEALLQAVDSYIPTPVRELDKPFLVPIDQAFSITGRGTVVTGRLERGVIRKGNEVEIIGYGKKKKSVVTGIEVFNQTLEEAKAGDKCGLLVRGVKKHEIIAGMILAKPQTVKLCNNFDAHIYVLTKEEGGSERPFLPYQHMHLFSRSCRSYVQAIVKDKEMVMPGEDTMFNIRFFKSMVLEKGQRFTLRDEVRTLATGVIVDIKQNLTPDEIDDMNRSKRSRAKLKVKEESKS